MTDILKKPKGVGPRTHALVIGVSHYRHFEGGDAPNDQGREWGMDQLSAAAASAGAVAEWLATEYRNPEAELQTLRVLVSPTPGENLPSSIAAKVTGDAHRATRANVEAALRDFVRDCEADRNNVAFVYIAGHGVQLTKHGAIVLLEDMGDPNHINPLQGAIDAVSAHRGLEHGRAAAHQFWFVDACRQRPEIAEQFERMTGALELTEKRGATVSSPLFCASSTREVAFARVGGRTLFCEALLGCLTSVAVVGPDPGCPDWHVTTLSLNEKLTERVAELAAAEDEVQTVDPGGRMAHAIVQRFDGEPLVRLQVNLAPKRAHKTTSAVLLAGAQSPVPNLKVGWPLKIDVKAGLYLLTLTTKPPFKPKSEILNLFPPSHARDVEVES